MSCDYPITAYLSRTVNPSGKRSLVFNSKESLSGIPQLIPCGRCTGCRLERSRVWAIRCMHEAKMHKENCFITVTFDNEHLPRDGSLSVDVYQKFLKRLRKHCARSFVKIRFYGCGEYGDINKRPHYHFIIFGYDFPDKVVYKQLSHGEYLYTSKLLDAVWGFGDCKIGSVTFDSAAYVARYCMKKVDGAMQAAGHYEVYDADGVLHDRLPEFATMSRRPGIASGYYDKFGGEIRVHDTIVVNAKEVPSIRYYDLKFEEIDAKAFKRVKRKRHPVQRIGRAAMLHENTRERRDVKAKLKDQSLKRKARSL